MGTARTRNRGAKSARAPAAGGQALRQSGPHLAYSKPQAAAALGISINSFERHVQPELRVVRRGKLRLFPATELERWLRENAELTLEER